MDTSLMGRVITMFFTGIIGEWLLVLYISQEEWKSQVGG
jgi:hypothetical protein